MSATSPAPVERPLWLTVAGASAVLPLGWVAWLALAALAPSLLAAYLGLGFALRLWRDSFPVVDGGTAILVHPFDRRFATATLGNGFGSLFHPPHDEIAHFQIVGPKRALEFGLVGHYVGPVSGIENTDGEHGRGTRHVHLPALNRLQAEDDL